LTYHVVPGKVMSRDIAGREMQVKTEQGSPVSIDATDDALKVDDSSVTQADMETDNGVHAIDSVITPEIDVGAGEDCAGGGAPPPARSIPAAQRLHHAELLP
jgi:uncharacterized surface protein with fasciclin (FAS1) repeats